LPLYLKLYDEAVPETRAAFTPFIARIVKGFEGQGVEVVAANVCRVEAEFRQAVAAFGEADVDLIVSVHLAYSPSLESVDALAECGRPILMLDTTMDLDFGQSVDPKRIMFNHGIHGVQDLASMLRRRGKAYRIVAGHVDDPRLFDRATSEVRGASGARALRSTRALRIGNSFSGMGDFAVEETVLRDVLGIRVDQVSTDALAGHVAKVTDAEVTEECRADRERFDVDVSDTVHARSVRVGLGLRRLLDEGGYDAFSMNFLAFDSADGPVNAVPFLEASKAMARGLGYAGEGDVLTASLVGALNRAFGRTTFTEIFCPDWKGGAIFLSHMGEVNPEVAAARPCVREKDFPYTPAHNPAVLACAPTPGPAVFVNLAPGPGDTFGVIASRVDVLEDTDNPTMRNVVRAWIRPTCPLDRFLEAYSMHGGTHHSALVMGDGLEGVRAFAAYAGLDCTEIPE